MTSSERQLLVGRLAVCAWSVTGSVCRECDRRECVKGCDILLDVGIL